MYVIIIFCLWANACSITLFSLISIEGNLFLFSFIDISHTSIKDWEEFMKKVSLAWRLVGSCFAFFVMVGILSVIRILFLHETDLSSFAMVWSIFWAIGYFVATTLCFYLKTKWSVGLADCIIIVLTLAMTWIVVSLEMFNVSTDLKHEILKAVASFLISLVFNNQDFEKVLSS